MLSSNSVLRRYTPPTCTLEIAAKDSPLSRWAGRSVLKHLRFQLTFDDPRQLDSEKLTLRGDRAQLEALCAAVETYVQNFLSQSFQPLETETVLASPRFEYQTALASAYPHASERSSEAAASLSRRNSSATSNEEVLRSSDPQIAPTEASLAAIERWDDGKDTNVVALEPADRAIAAGIRLEPIGLLSHRLCLGSLADHPSSSTLRLSTSQLFDLASALDEYAADVMALPNLNRPAWLQPSSAWLRTAAIALVTVGLSTSVLKLLDQPTTVQETTAPLTSQGASSEDQQRVATQIAPLPSPPATGSPLALGGQPLPPPPPPGSIIAPPASLPAVPPAPQTAAPEITAIAPESGALESFGGGPPATDNSANSGEAIAIPEPRIALELPAAPPAGSTSQSADLPSIAAAPSAKVNPDVELGALRSAAPPAPETAPAPPEASPGDTLFDTIPQVAEVRDYFRQQWEPPAGLKQTIEYNLLLNPDGSIQQILPLGQAAGDYIDRTGMPLVGEPFVSPVPGGRTPRIRVVLSPDGEVRTFLEALQ